MNIITLSMENDDHIVQEPKKGLKMRPDVLLLLFAISMHSKTQNCLMKILYLQTRSALWMFLFDLYDLKHYEVEISRHVNNIMLLIRSDRPTDECNTLGGLFTPGPIHETNQGGKGQAPICSRCLC